VYTHPSTSSHFLTTAGNDNGLGFWSGHTTYAIKMGNNQANHGTVTDYSMHHMMDSTAGRGFTFGTSRTAVSASINALTGAAKFNGSVTASAFLGDGSQLTGIQSSPYDTASSSTGYFDLPSGTTSQRPSGSDGMTRFNTTLGIPEWYSSDKSSWIPFADLPPVDLEYLVIAGGASGGIRGSRFSGGGGAGGYRSSVIGQSSGGGASAESVIAATPGSSISVIVGAGGAGQNAATTGHAGGTSSFSNISCVGGGGGGMTSGGSGGSGGGSCNGQGSPGSGTSGQGYAGGHSVDNGYGGGGGGAGEAGNTDGNGQGGDGVSSTITGSAVTRAGGGGGSSSGGLGGGGNYSAGSGSANTGGGGAGRHSYGTSGAGGSGIVIVRYVSATPRYAGGTITQTGGYVIHKFTSSGTLQAI
jgi:hypothetical protein